MRALRRRSTGAATRREPYRVTTGSQPHLQTLGSEPRWWSSLLAAIDRGGRPRRIAIGPTSITRCKNLGRVKASLKGSPSGQGQGHDRRCSSRSGSLWSTPGASTTTARCRVLPQGWRANFHQPHPVNRSAGCDLPLQGLPIAKKTPGSKHERRRCDHGFATSVCCIRVDGVFVG